MKDKWQVDCRLWISDKARNVEVEREQCENGVIYDWCSEMITPIGHTMATR